MSSITNGLFGGGKGLGFTAEAAQLDKPSTIAQADQQYNQVQQGLGQQQDLVQALANQNGIQNQSDVYNQLGQVASGQLNPAQAQLNQNTQANVANQAALMASQRGAGANPALLARQAAMAGGNLQQNAIGQAATLQANNQMNAIGAQGNLATQQVAQQQAAQQAYNANALQGQSNVLQSISNQNQAALGNTQQQNAANASIANATIGLQGDIVKGVTSAAGGAAKLAHGGPVSPMGLHFHKMAKGGKVPALVSPGEKYLDPKDVQKVANGANPLKTGETIPGKPKVAGAKDSYANDTVSRLLDEGGIVLPRSVTQAKDAPKKASKFVEEIQRKKALKKD